MPETSFPGICNCWPPCDKHPGTLVHCHHGDGIGERPQTAHSWTPETRSAYEAGREKGRDEERARIAQLLLDDGCPRMQLERLGLLEGTDG